MWTQHRQISLSNTYISPVKSNNVDPTSPNFTLQHLYPSRQIQQCGPNITKSQSLILISLPSNPTMWTQHRQISLSNTYIPPVKSNNVDTTSPNLTLQHLYPSRQIQQCGPNIAKSHSLTPISLPSNPTMWTQHHQISISNTYIPPVKSNNVDPTSPNLTLQHLYLSRQIQQCGPNIAKSHSLIPISLPSNPTMWTQHHQISLSNIYISPVKSNNVDPTSPSITL